jgi:hypothetical protein
MQSRASNRGCFRVVGLSSFLFVRAPFIRASLMLLVAGGATLFLAGCGPRRVKADFKHYENSYAVTSNREELLNLARLDQHDPTYFFKLGQISSSYRMEAALTGTGQVSTVSSPPATTIPTGGGSPTFLYENDPSFTMIPVSDDTNAQILLKPVSAGVFYSLYLQGWRLDQLFRLTVSRIELTLPTAHGCEVKVIRNSAPPSFDAPNYANDGFSLASYITFLRVSAVIYALQKHGLLLLRGTSTFEPIDHGSFIPTGTVKDDDSAKKPAGADTSAINALITQARAADVPVSVSITAAQGGGGDAAPKSASAPAAKDFDDASAKGQVWQLQKVDSDSYKGDAWVLGANAIEPQFQLTTHGGQAGADAPYAAELDKNNQPAYGQNIEKIKNLLVADFKQQDSGMQELLGATQGEGPDLTEILEILYNGFSIEESSVDQNSEDQVCAGAAPNRITAHLVMRSLIGLMAAAAQEQDSFDKLQQTDPTAPTSEIQSFIGEIYAAAHQATTNAPPSPAEINNKMMLVKLPLSFKNLVPQIEQVPVLKLKWPDGRPHDAEQLFELGMALKYRDHDYFVADSEESGSGISAFIPENKYWNRDMFRLINELSSQVSIDPSKYPLPEILQLRTE